MPGLDMSHARKGVKARFSQVWTDKPRPGHIEGEPFDGLAVVVLLTLVAAAFLIHLALNVLWHAFSILNESAPNQTVAGIICGSFALGVGACFYQLRKRQRGIYALIEIAF